MKKKAFGLFATLLIVAQTAWAQVTVTTAANLLEAVKTSQTVKLGADITTPSEGGRLDINNGITVTLDLNGHTLKRNMTAVHPGGQAIIVNEGGKLTIMDSGTGGTITGGWANGGGGVYVRAGGELTITGGIITGNRTVKDADGNWGFGGGVENHGTMTMTGGTITGNTAEQFGGGIHNEGTLTMTGGSIADNNSGTFGGAIYSNSTVSINNATISGNKAQSGGGAICTEGTLTLEGVTITGNSSDNYGGGIYMFKSATSPGIVQLQGECTITGNTAQAGSGIFQVTNGAGVDGPTLKMQDKPVVDNNTNDNVYLQSYQLITLTGAFQTGARVGVCCEDLGQETFTSGYVDHNGTADPSTFFFFSSPTVNGVVNKEDREVGFTIKGYNYVECNWDGGKVTEVEKSLYLNNVNVHVLSGIHNGEGDWLPLEGGHYYIVTGNAEYTALQVQNCINTSGAHLILCNGTQLKVNNGVKVEQGNTLHIHGQAGNTGKLIATNVKYEGAAIGGGTEGATAGDITIHGGTITAEGGDYGAGIGGADQGNAGDITIYGGIIKAYGGKEATGIGSGDDCGAASAGNITIYGGTIKAWGGSHSAAIGGGEESNGATIRIYGGDITAKGLYGSTGIGNGYCSGRRNASWGDIFIYGGTIHTKGGDSYHALGGGCYSTTGTISIEGGTVYAEANNGTYVIGSGNEWDAGNLASTGTVTISGGTVYATSKGSGEAWQGVIGGGTGLTVNIIGGEIHASFASNHSAVYDKTVFTLAPYMMVLMGSDASTAQRQDANGRYTALLDNDMEASYALIKPCDHAVKTVSHFDDTYHYFKCSYCDTSADQNSEVHTYNDSGNGICEVCGKGREWTLYDAQDNSPALEEYDGKPAAKVTLSGRTLYRDGSWNTLCLPFDVEIETSPLAGAKAMQLNNATLSSKGTLTLDFKDVISYTINGATHTFLQAGVPYIIVWEGAAQEPLTNPEFTGCRFTSTQPADISFNGVLTFRGTYSPMTLASGNSTLYVSDNGLSYPSAETPVNAFRAVFELKGIADTDLNTLTAIILGKAETTDAADVNGDKQVTIADIATFINQLINSGVNSLDSNIESFKQLDNTGNTVR